MRLRTYKEAMEFVKLLLAAKEGGKRELPSLAKLDSVPAWSGTSEHKLDGSEVEAVYLSYLPATEKQKKEADTARLAGVKLERISGRLIDVRQVKDGTVQVLFSNGLRNADGSIPFRGPNVDKGILCYLAVNEGLGEPVEDIIARVPNDLLEKLKAGKAKGKKGKGVADNPNQIPLVTVPVGPAEETPAAPEVDKVQRLKLK